jgi:hypothetical protein
LYYIRKKRQIELEINKQKIKAGIDKNKKIWCEIPIEGYKIINVDNEIYKVILKGITILVVGNEQDYINLKEKTKKLSE